MVILQSCLQVLRGTETCAASSGDGKQFFFVNVGDDDSVMKWQEDPEPTTSTAVKNDPVVSCVSVCIVCYVHCTDTDCCCLSVHLSSSNSWKGDHVFNISYEIVSGIFCL